MQESLASLVHPLLDYGLGLRARLEAGEAPGFAADQATLEGLLAAIVGEGWVAPGHDHDHDRDAESRDGGAPRRGPERLVKIQYALVCWLDELFILDSPWEAAWNERKLEVALYGTNDRAWRFWDQARRPETRADGDVLEVFFLCVMLGFRGELRERADALNDWVDATRAQLAGRLGREWQPPPEFDPPTDVPPLRGREGLRRAVLVGGLVILASIPPAAFFVIYQLGQ